MTTPPHIPLQNLSADRPQRSVAMVTGASSGIGLAIAQRLAADGYDLAICARRQQRLMEVAQSLRQQGVTVLAQTVDLRDEAQILSFFAAVKNHWGRLNVLVNNAGLGHNEPMMTGKTDAWREMLDVNVLALCICTREAISLMNETETETVGLPTSEVGAATEATVKAGQIVHISSMSGHRVPAIAGIYSATKFAVRSLSETLRRELRAANSNIRITAISPGIVETEFAQKYHQSVEQAKTTYSQFPVLQASDIANAVAYALSQPSHVEVNDILLRPTQQSS
ncbi:MAG: SDR family NAD(P)-dependent oxidoreductase [Phormidesmis sp. RL_2_1]|nr:SDR family NAD(P)-dependent oxidoreductase [Phormidesmis sp. RL_2_1]